MNQSITRYSLLLVVSLVILEFASCKNSKKAKEETPVLPTTKVESSTEATKPERQKAQPERVMSDDDIEVVKSTDESETGKVADDGKYKPEIAKDVYFLMIKTPCFGRCPVYNFEVKLNGQALLEGIRFFDYEGKHQAKLSEDQLNQIAALAEKYNYFQLDHVYDAPVTDLPSSTTALRVEENVQWVYNRMNAPETLGQFEMEIEAMIKELEWKPAPEDSK